MVIRLVHDAPDLLAGAAMIASNLPAAGNATVEQSDGSSVPLICIHGTEDSLSPYAGGDVGFRGRFSKGPHLSAAQTAAYFARHNGIDTPPTFRWLAPDEACTSGQVCRTDYRQHNRPPVTLYTIGGGGHQIPGASRGMKLLFGRPTSAIDTVGVIGEFFGLDAVAAA